MSETITHPSQPPSDGLILAGLREVCLVLPGVEERVNHGMPTFGIVGRRAFANLHENQFDGRSTLWFKAAPGVQDELVEQESDRFFVPPYLGQRGWMGLHLDVDLDWQEVAGMVEEAWRLTAPKRLIAELDG